MQTTKLTGLIVKAADYGEHDKMLTLITPQDEKIELIARGARRQASKLLAACAPFCYANFVCNVNGTRLSVTQAEMLESYYALREDMAKLSAGGCVLALLEKSATGSMQGIFELSLYTLSFLCYTSNAPVDLLICFLVQAMDRMGYKIAATACAKCHRSTFEQARFTAQNGALCRDCAQGRGMPIDALSLEAIFRMNKLALKEMDKVVLPQVVCAQLLKALLDYCQYHLDWDFRRLTHFAELYAIPPIKNTSSNQPINSPINKKTTKT